MTMQNRQEFINSVVTELAEYNTARKAIALGGSTTMSIDGTSVTVSKDYVDQEISRLTGILYILDISEPEESNGG